MPRPTPLGHGGSGWDTYIESVFTDLYGGGAGTPSPTAAYATPRSILMAGNSITHYLIDNYKIPPHVNTRIGDIGNGSAFGTTGDIKVIAAAYDGGTSATISGNLPPLYAGQTAGVTWALIVPSINDRKIDGSGTTTASTMYEVRRQIGLARMNQAIPIVCTEGPINIALLTPGGQFSWASDFDRRAVNDTIRQLCAAQTSAGQRLVLADIDAAFAHYDVSYSTNSSGDGLHPIHTGNGGFNGMDIMAECIVNAMVGEDLAVRGQSTVLPTLGGSDDFNRPDSTTSLGGLWTADWGTWGITSNHAYEVGDEVFRLATLDTTVTDHEAVATCVAPSAGAAYTATAMTRNGGGSGWYLADLEVTAGASTGRDATVKLFAVNGTGPVGTQIATITIGGITDSVDLTLASVGSLHTVRVNGLTVVEQTDTTYPTGTKVGLNVLGAPRWDNFAWYH